MHDKVVKPDQIRSDSSWGDGDGAAGQLLQNLQAASSIRSASIKHTVFRTCDVIIIGRTITALVIMPQ